MRSKTVIIKTDNGPVTIDESNYDPKVHTLHTEAIKEKAKGLEIEVRGSKPESLIEKIFQKEVGES